MCAREPHPHLVAELRARADRNPAARDRRGRVARGTRSRRGRGDGRAELPRAADSSGYRGAIWQSATENGVRVHRSWLRVRPEEQFVDKALYELTFAAFSAPRVVARLRRAHVVVCVVPSLVAATIAATLSRRTRLVLWVQDLVGVASRAVADAPGAAISVARSLERYATARADKVVVCSPGFGDYFIRIGTDPRRIETILNWVDTNSLETAHARERPRKSSVPLLRQPGLHARIRNAGRGSQAGRQRRRARGSGCRQR